MRARQAKSDVALVHMRLSTPAGANLFGTQTVHFIVWSPVFFFEPGQGEILKLRRDANAVF